MATTQSDEDAISRNFTNDSPCPVTKQVLRAAIQAIEGVFESPSMQTALSNAINTATSPVTMTAAQKRKLVKHWLKSRFERGN